VIDSKPSKNSTTGRSNIGGGLLVARRALQGLDAFAPALAAHFATRWMFRTRRRAMDTWEREVVEHGKRLAVDGPSGALAAYQWGEGPLVLLVHGWNGRASQLGSFVVPLVAAGFRVVAFDAPGHGASAGSRSSIVEFVSAFERVLDQVRPFFRPLHGIIAHSMGGSAVTLALARASGRLRLGEARPSDGGLSRPRLVFIAPPIDLRDMTAGFSTALGLGGATRVAMESLVERQLGTRLDDLHALRLASLMHSPLLVLHDDADRAVPLDNGRRLVAAWPGAELGVTRGLGHSRILRDDATVRRAVDFVRGPTRAVSFENEGRLQA
jgi:pimeloyl-ACP methyl ester carboxylesterase